jgi:hypothetical protein
MFLLKRLFSSAHNRDGANKTSCLPGWALALACLFLLAVAGIYAYTASFSSFAAYDDEGYMMITVQGFLRSYPLYDQVLTVYGPVYYFYEWMIHSAAGMPLTHDVTRLVCMFDWLVAASLLALAAVRITRSALSGLFVLLQAVLHLRSLVSEPGHPQELIAVLLACAALAATWSIERKSTLVVLGSIGAALVFTKINAGAFFVFAFVLALCCRAPFFQADPRRFYPLLALLSLVPFALMRPHLSESLTCVYATHECAAILCAGAVAYTFSDGPAVSRAAAFQAGGAFVGLSALFILVLVLNGSSMAAMAENLVIALARLGSLYFDPLRLPRCWWWSVGAFLSGAFMVTLRLQSNRWRLAIVAAKAIYGWMGAVEFLTHYNQALGYLLPWSWLVVVSPKRGDLSATPNSFARSFLCLTAVWQGLHAYPVAGTQKTLATFLLVLVYSVCLYDAFKALVEEPWVIRHVGKLDPRTPLMIETLFLAIVLCLAVEWCHPSGAWDSYTSLPPLGLRGSSHLRVRLAQTDSYHALTEFIETNSDAFITLPGLNSLYFWTGRSPPGYFINGGVVWMNHDQQARLVTRLQSASHPMIVLTDPPSPAGTPVKGVAYAYPGGPLSRVIREQYHEVKRIGIFRILALRDGAN